MKPALLFAAVLLISVTHAARRNDDSATVEEPAAVQQSTSMPRMGKNYTLPQQPPTGFAMPAATIVAISQVTPRFQDAGLLPVLAAIFISPQVVDGVLSLFDDDASDAGAVWRSIRASLMMVGICTAVLW